MQRIVQEYAAIAMAMLLVGIFVFSCFVCNNKKFRFFFLPCRHAMPTL